jgi:hypothetical protein
MNTAYQFWRFLFLTVACASLLLPAQAITIYQSATLGQPGNSGYDLSDQYLGWEFQLNSPFQVQAIGGDISGSGTFFGAIVQLSGPSALPSGSPFDSSTIATTTFAGPGYSMDLSIPISVTLAAGDYALIFGGNQFGASGSGTMPFDNSDLPGSDYLVWHDPSHGAYWSSQTGMGMRFVVEGVPVPEPATAVLFAVGSGMLFVQRIRTRRIREQSLHH